MKHLEKKIRSIPNFPKDGIVFRDITSLLHDSEGLRDTVDLTVERWTSKGITKIVGIDARGFILGGAVAYKLGVGFLPVRKHGKLPPETISQKYQLEYGEDVLELSKGFLEPTDKVLIIDDLIATGGTALASISLVKDVGATVLGCSFVINLPELGGIGKIENMGIQTFSICNFPGL
jgi:adenine phosphoribosyltransferase